MKTNIQHLATINDLLLKYKAEIELTAMKPLAKKTYIYNTQNFVRWISGDFIPGGKRRIIQVDSMD